MQRSVLPFLLLSLVAAPVLAQKATPRDVFWSASDLVSVSANPGAKKHTRAPAPRHTRAEEPTRTREASEPTRHVNPMLVSESGYGAQPHLLRIASTQLGLRYSLLLRNAQGEYQEVSPSAVFHSGDHLRLSIMANEPGYLYVIQKGSSGSWSSIFPKPGSAMDANRVEQGHVYQIPGNTMAFQFDQHPGTEKLFVVLSRQPIRDLDNTISGLQGPAPAPAAAQPERQPAGQLLEASNRIPDDLVQRLASRDLTLVAEQQVDDAPKGESSGEKAVYVVAKSGGSSSPNQVVTQITLRHD